MSGRRTWWSRRAWVVGMRVVVVVVVTLMTMMTMYEVVWCGVVRG